MRIWRAWSEYNGPLPNHTHLWDSNQGCERFFMQNRDRSFSVGNGVFCRCGEWKFFPTGEVINA